MHDMSRTVLSINVDLLQGMGVNILGSPIAFETQIITIAHRTLPYGSVNSLA